MNIILVRKHKGRMGNVKLSRGQFSVLAFIALAVVPGLLMYAGFYLGQEKIINSPDTIFAELREELQGQQNALDAKVQEADENMDALAMRLGQLQAHVIRLDALGQRMTTMAGLDKGEFDFEQQPGQGGPEASDAEPMGVPDFLSALENLSQQLEDRDQQMQVLESMLMNRNLQAEVFPAGRPIKRGWLSSYYGMRTDPFTGHQALHEGIDFAGKAGSDVISVGAGVVTWAGKRYGYGNMVEVTHGNGYVTRYGHNEDIVVNVGETVKKGQVLSKMGSTGRSTGPHVHFEVLLNGRKVDPEKFIRKTANS